MHVINKAVNKLLMQPRGMKPLGLSCVSYKYASKNDYRKTVCGGSGKRTVLLGRGSRMYIVALVINHPVPLNVGSFSSYLWRSIGLSILSRLAVFHMMVQNCDG